MLLVPTAVDVYQAMPVTGKVIATVFLLALPVFLPSAIFTQNKKGPGAPE